MKTLAIRVKRRHDEDAAATLSVQCKRRCGASDVCFDFAGTLSSLDDAAASLQVAQAAATAGVAAVARPSGACLSVSQSQLLSVAAQRKRVHSSSDSAGTTSKSLRLLDLRLEDVLVVPERITCNGEPLEVLATEFVYDIYYSAAGPTTELDTDGWLLQAFEEDALGDGCGSDAAGSDDSNAEDDWRNDYPEERSHSSGSAQSSDSDELGAYTYADYDWHDEDDALCESLARQVTLEDVQSFSSTEAFRQSCSLGVRNERLLQPDDSD